MRHIRAVVNQAGVAMELHGHKDKPIMLDLISWAELGAYREDLAKSNPDWRHAVIGQLAVMYAQRIYQGKIVEVSPCAWSYNASTNEYSQERG